MAQTTDVLYDLEFPELQALLTGWKVPAYRARQVWEWLYVHQASAFDQMTSLPRSLRDRLAAQTTIGALQTTETLQSTDGQTRKDLLQLADGETIETVLMSYERRRTVCVSTQVGCSMGCKFCATGQTGFRRNLSAGEIVAQVVHFARILKQQGQRLSNVVLMGMGEPMLNYEPSLTAIRRLIDPRALGIGQRRITLSTVGIVPGIDRLAREEGSQPGSPLQIKLAISLHAATDDLRTQLIPINHEYGLNALFAACHRYQAQTNRRITFEWALIEKLNDTPQQALALVHRLSGLMSHVNLIPINPTKSYPGQPPSQRRIDTFSEVLERHGVPHTIRLRRGIDIQAGCGQLRQRHSNR